MRGEWIEYVNPQNEREQNKTDRFGSQWNRPLRGWTDQVTRSSRPQPSHPIEPSLSYHATTELFLRRLLKAQPARRLLTKLAGTGGTVINAVGLLLFWLSQLITLSAPSPSSESNVSLKITHRNDQILTGISIAKHPRVIFSPKI